MFLSFSISPVPLAICFFTNRAFSSSASATETQQVAFIRSWPPADNPEMLGQVLPNGNNFKLDEISENKTVFKYPIDWTLSGDTSWSTPSDPLCQLHVFWHNGHSLRVNGTQVGVLKQLYDITFSPLLKCNKGASLDTKIWSILLNDAPDEALERQLPDQQLC